MKRALLLSLVIFALAAGIASSQQQVPVQPTKPVEPPQAQQPSRQGAIVLNVNVVDVLFAVVNRRQRIVPGLNQEDFKVFDDGVPQEIITFARPTDLPLRVGLVLDTSNSIRDRLRFEQDAAIDFMFNVLRRNKDQAFLMTFDDGPQVIQDFTGDAGTLRDVILKQRAGGGTSLYDAVYVASERLLTKSPAPSEADSDIRRVLVVISDGDDNSSRRSRGEAVEMAHRAGVVVYAISTSTNWLTSHEERNPVKMADRKYHKEAGDRVLEQLAEETGGRAFFPYRVDDLGQSFLDIGDELRTQYAITYSPAGRTADGKFHTIKIEVNRKDVTVRTRKGYYAVPAPPLTSNP